MLFDHKTAENSQEAVHVLGVWTYLHSCGIVCEGGWKEPGPYLPVPLFTSMEGWQLDECANQIGQRFLSRGGGGERAQKLSVLSWSDNSPPLLPVMGCSQQLVISRVSGEKGNLTFGSVYAE